MADLTTIDSAELARLIEADQMLQYLVETCTYLADSFDCIGDHWQTEDETTLLEYLRWRLAGSPDLEPDTDFICPDCNGTGEGKCEDSTCKTCGGSGEVGE